jgi:hypothetical protein
VGPPGSSCLQFGGASFSIGLHGNASGQACGPLSHPVLLPVTQVNIQERGMYTIRRIYKTQPGKATEVAKLLHKQATIYRDAGQRSEFTVSYNGYTLPGEQNIVVLEWSDEAIKSPSRPGNDIPREALEVGAEVRKLIESQRIEFLELLTPAQA